jgi:ketosteroid isomerase-like protein
VGCSDSFVKGHIEKWVNAWNNHDLKTVLSMYSDSVEFSSPKIKVVFPERKSSKITSKSDLEGYWTEAMKNNFPNLRFTPKEIIFQKKVCIFEYYATLDGKSKTSVIEKFEFEDGLIIKSSVFYGSDEPV